MSIAYRYGDVFIVYGFRFYIAEIICGLEYLHLQGVVHR